MRLKLRDNPSGKMRVVTAWTGALLAAGLLAGCGTGDTSLQPAAARQLQARVLEVSEASSRNDPAAAMKALEGLEAELAAAQSKGQISEERRQTIATIATAVRADLQEAIAAAAKAAEDAKIAADQAAGQASPPSAEAPAPEPAPAPAPAPAPEPAPAPAPEPEPAPESGNNSGSKDDEGKGKGKD